MTRILKWLMSASLLSSGSLLAQPVELKYAHQPAPAYPRSLYEQGVSGLVLVEFRGHSDGSITDVKSPHPNNYFTHRFPLPQRINRFPGLFQRVHLRHQRLQLPFAVPGEQLLEVRRVVLWLTLCK